MSVRKKALDREGCFYYALALGIDLGRLQCLQKAAALPPSHSSVAFLSMYSGRSLL